MPIDPGGEMVTPFSPNQKSQAMAADEQARVQADIDRKTQSVVQGDMDALAMQAQGTLNSSTRQLDLGIGDELYADAVANLGSGTWARPDDESSTAPMPSELRAIRDLPVHAGENRRATKQNGGYVSEMEKYAEAATEASPYIARMASRRDLDYRQRSLGAFSYAGKVQADFTRVGVLYNQDGYTFLAEAAIKAYNDAGLVLPGEGVIAVSSPLEAGQAAVAMIPENARSANFGAMNIYDYGGIQIGPPDGNIYISHDDPYNILIGTIQIKPGFVNAAGQALLFEAAKAAGADKPLVLPGLSADDFDQDVKSPLASMQEYSQDKNDQFNRVKNNIGAAVTVADTVAAAINLTTTGQVEVYYSPQENTYSYLVKQNTPTPNGWEMKSVIQNNNSLFKQVQEGIYK